MDVFPDADGSVMQFYSDLSEPPGSFTAASVSVDNHEPLESESHFLAAYSLCDAHQLTNEISPEIVQLDPPLSAKTIQCQYVSNEHSSDLCISSICFQERNRLAKRVQDLSRENQNLLASSTETRKRLVENELQLGLAQDSNSRLQVNFNSEILTLRNTNWMLEQESNTLKSENSALKEMLAAVNSELVRVYEKINKLFALNPTATGDRDQNSFNVIQNSVNQNNNFVSSTNACAETNCVIKQINYKLDNAIQQKKNDTILRGYVDDQFTQECQHTEKSIMDHIHDHGIESTEELHRQISYKLMDELQTQLSPIMCETKSQEKEITHPNNINSSSHQKIMNKALYGNANGYGMIYTNVGVDDLQPISPTSNNLFQKTKRPRQEEDDDDDITIITEIKRNTSINQSSTRAGEVNLYVQSSTSSLFVHAMDYDSPGFTCTCGGMFSSLGKLDEHLRQHSLDGKLHCTDCDATFFSTPKLQLHMEEAHQVLVLDQCKECGKVFKSRNELLRHEKSTHEYGSHSTDSTPKDFVDELIDETGIMQQMSTTAKETTKTIRLTANPQSASAYSAVDIETPAYTFGKKVPSTLPQPQTDPSHSRHGLDVARNSLPGEFFWCICGSRYITKAGLQNHVTSQIIFVVPVAEIFQALME